MANVYRKIFDKTMKNMYNSFHDIVKTLNSSKLFAGLIVITLNVATKFVNIKLGKTMESYLKFTFSKQILVFAMAWMGTRDIYAAFCISIVFIICMDYLFHEDSMFFCLPSKFRDYHIKLLDDEKVSEEEIIKAKEVLARAKRNNKTAGKSEDEEDENALSLEDNSKRRRRVPRHKEILF